MKLTREEAAEFRRCAESVVYFCKNYVYIKHITRGAIKWVPYPGALGDPDWQTSILQDLQDGESLVLLKSRQVGASWTVSIFVSWLILFRSDMEVLLLSQKEKKAIKLLGKIKFICTHLPDFLSREFNSDTQTRLSVIHKRRGQSVKSESSVDSLTTTGESGRGDTARLVFLDELAHLDNAEETWTAIKPTTSHGGQVVAASSPKGNSGPFARLWMEADSGASVSFRPVRVHYTDCGFDNEWLGRASDGMTEAQIQQEFELAFLGTGSPAFDPNHVRAAYCPVDDMPEDIKRLYKTPTKKYASGVDSAEIRVQKKTRRRDFNAITALNEYGIQVAAEANQMPLEEWAGNTLETARGTVDVPGYVTKWHARFPGIMFVEENGAGLVVENRHKLPDDLISEMAVRRTTSKSKPRLVNQFILGLAGGQVVITDKRTYYQLLTYEDLGNGKYSAPEGLNDDLVIAILEAYDALIEMGGYEFDFSILASSAGATPVVSPLDFDIDQGIPTMPSMDQFIPSDRGAVEFFNEWNELDPRRLTIGQLTETIGRAR